MSEHLAECIVPDFDRGIWVCICDQLRACEKRVLEDTVPSEWHWKTSIMTDQRP